MYLPSPPSPEEKLSYADPNPYPFGLAGLLLLAVFCYSSYYFLTKTMSWWMIPYLLFCAVYVANLGFCSLGSLLAQPFNLQEHKQRMGATPEYYPSVDVYLPNCGEPLSILTNSYRAVSLLDWPAHLLNVYVLDDVGDPLVEQLAHELGFHYLSRPNKGHLKKAGNMRYAFSRTQGDLILVLDADFAPCVELLKETVPYFTDEKLAILQTPQYFVVSEDQSPIQKGSTYLQEVFHRLIQSFRDRWGASVCTGSCALYRRAALAPFGGAAPVPRSEDVNTGLSVLRTGWSIKYLPLNLASGLSPDTVKSFFNQQYRWCSGSLHLVSSMSFCRSDIGLLVKVSYLLSILYYLCSGLGSLMFTLPSLINVWLYPQSMWATNYMLIVPTILAVIAMRGVWSSSPWGTQVLMTAEAASFTHLVAISDVVGGSVEPWVPTGAALVKGTKSRYDRFRLLAKWTRPLQVAALLAGYLWNAPLVDPMAMLPCVLLLLVSWLSSYEVLVHDEQQGDC